MSDDTRNAGLALGLAVVGLGLAATVTLVLFLNGMHDAKDVAAVAGIFTGITGTLVGTFLGVHVGATGKAKLQADRDWAISFKEKAMSRLPQYQREAVIKEMGDG
jgi:vacuolar-type H+-ATPase subunit I/STV1